MIELKNVSFRYKGTSDSSGVTDINLTIPDGQVILLCGRSGCGKTTITRLLNGLVPNYYEGEFSGEVLLDGAEISTLSLYETAKHVGSVFQNPRTQFFNVDTTSEMAFGCENRGLPEQEIATRVLRAADDLNVRLLLGRNIFHLSGGEKQKIACASVSVAGPQIIILDEPTSNLDMLATLDLKRMIATWKAQGKTVVIAEHRLYYLSSLIDRAILMDNGRIIGDYTASEMHAFHAKQLEKMGLRPLDISVYPVQPKDLPSLENIGIKGFYFTHRDGTRALDIDALTFPKNQVVALIGHNGAGKTTFARVLCGLERRGKGTLSVDGSKYNRKKRLKHSYLVMQDVNHQLFTESVEEEILLGMQVPDRERGLAIAMDLDLADYFDRHPMSLSGGQKQRVAIASAIAAEREILVFDEPTSGLDLQHMEEVALVLQKMTEKGKSVIVITHDFELVASACSYVIRLENGAVAEQYALDGEGLKRLKTFFAG